MMADRIEVLPARRGMFVWHIVAANGRIRANGETFPSRGNAVRAVKAHARNLAATFGVTLEFKTLRRGDTTIIYPIMQNFPRAIQPSLQ